MLLRANTRYSEEDQMRRDDLRNHLLSLNSMDEPESSNVWNALPGSKWGSCTDLLTGSKSRPLSKALQPKTPKDEQRSFSFSYRAPVLALPPTLPLTKAPRRMESSELYKNQRQSKQRTRTNSFGGFASQTLSTAPSREADKGLVGVNNNVKTSRHELSPERYVAPYSVTLQRPESPLPGTAQAHAQMLWIEKVRRGSETSLEYTGKEPLRNSKAKETYINYPNREQIKSNTGKEPYWNNQVQESHRHYIQEEQSRKNTKVEPHWNSQEKEPSWKDTNKKLHSNYTESEPYYNAAGLESRLNNNGKASYRNNPENESHWSNLENEPRFNYAEAETSWDNREKEPIRNNPVKEPYFSYAEMETGRNNPEKEQCLANLEKQPRSNSPAKESCWNNIERESQCNNREKYSSHFNHVDIDTPWNKLETQSRLCSSEEEPHRNNKEKEPSCSDTENEQHWNNRKKHPYSSHNETESHWNITAKEPHQNGEEKIQRWNNTDKEPHLNGNGPHWNNPEKESSRNKKIKEPHCANSDENQHQRPKDSAILPSRYTHTSPSARLCDNQPSSSVEPAALYSQRTPLTQPKTSYGGEHHLETSPLYKLSSFRYGSGRESPRGIQQNDPARTDDLVRGRHLSKKTPFDEKTTDFQTSDRTYRDRALSQGTLPRLLNKYISGSAIDLSQGYDDPRGSGERTIPRKSERRITSATHHRAKQVPSNAKLISDKWRTLDSEERTSTKCVTGRSAQTPPALYKTRSRWASLDREGPSQKESITRRPDQSSRGNAAQLVKSRKSIFEQSDPVTENTVRKRQDSSRSASCTPSEQTPRSSATEGLDRETTYSNYRSRDRSFGNLSPSSRRLYGSEMNLASVGSRQDPSYLAMTSSRYPSGKGSDQYSNATGSERCQSETVRLSSPRLNHTQPSGTSAPHCTSSVQLKLIPQRSDFYSATLNGQSEDVTRSVSSFSHMEPTTESNTGTLTNQTQFTAACDFKLAEPSATHTQGMGSKLTRPFGTTVGVTGYHWGEAKTQMSDGNLTEDSGIGFSDNNIRSSSASARDDSKFNREIMMDGGRLVRGASVDQTTSGGSATLNFQSPFVGQSVGVSSSGYSEKDPVKRRDEKEENTSKEIFTKEHWISSARMTGKSPTPMENKVTNVRSDDRRTQVHNREASTGSSDRSAPPVEWRVPLDNRETNAQSSDRSAPPVEWRAPLDNMEASTRKDERGTSYTEQSVKQDLNSAPRKSTAAKWKEFLSGPVETDSACKVQGHQYDEWHKEDAITIGESLCQSNGGQWKLDPKWRKEEGSINQLPSERKEASRMIRTTENESVFDADEEMLRGAGNRRDFIVSKTSLERIPTSEKSSVRKSSNVEDRTRRGDIQIADMSQCAEKNDRNMENCNGGAQGLREVEICVQRGALGVGFCVEGGMQSTTGDKPITIKRIFAGANGHLRGKLRPGDEILRVNDKDFRQMSHYNAWNFLKTLPEGSAKLLIFSK